MKTSERRLQVVVLSTCVLGALAFGVSAILSRTNGSTEALTAILVFSPLVILAANLDVLTRGDVGMSGNAMVLIGSIVVFRECNFILGVAIVGACVGIDYVQIRGREWMKVAFNFSAGIVSLVLAAVPFWFITDSSYASGTVRLIIATCVAGCVYLASNTLLVGLPVSISSNEPYWTVARNIAPYDVPAFPFAVLGLGLGWVYLELGAVVVPLLVVPILIARSTFASYLELRAAQEQTIQTLILALEAKDRYTAGHAHRVATFCEYVGTELGFGNNRKERLRYAALMHDIGKLIVPNQLLNKPGRLTESEFERVRRHEGVSVELLRRIDFLSPIAGDTTTEAATAAVEGTGLVEPAIIHVADAFDAMTSTRSYRKALTQETAFEELRSGAGTQFNADCVEALIQAIERRGEHYGAGFEVDTHEWDVAPPEVGTGSAGLGDVLPDRSRERAAQQ
jgi:hypothetical protein